MIQIYKKIRNKITTVRSIVISDNAAEGKVDKTITSMITTEYGDGSPTTTKEEVETLVGVKGTVVAVEDVEKVTYSPYTKWATTTDVAPYTDTEFVSYSYDTAITDLDFKANYFNTYISLMENATAEGTPYHKSIDYLDDELKKLNLSKKETAVLKAQYMANITSSITLQSMQFALSLTDKDLKAPSEISMLVTQQEIATLTKQDKVDSSNWQTQTAEENYNYAKEKALALPASIIFNNMSKGVEHISELYGQHKVGGGTITETMWLPPLEGVKALLTSDQDYAFTFSPDTTTTSE